MYLHNGNPTFWRGSQYVQVGQAWSADDVIHITCVWDRAAGFDGAKTMALYWNGSEIGNNTTAFNSTAADGVYIGKLHNGSPFDGSIDNLKIWDTAVDYSNIVKFQGERDGLNDQIIII